MALGARKNFDEKTKRRTFIEQDGRCFDCGVQIPRSLGRFDHDIPDALGGSNKRENCRFRCRDKCDNEKTNGIPGKPLSGDKSRIAKFKRQIEDSVEFYDKLAAKECGQPREKTGSIPGRGFGERSRPMSDEKSNKKSLRIPMPPLPRPSLFRDLTPEELAARKAANGDAEQAPEPVVAKPKPAPGPSKKRAKKTSKRRPEK